MSRPPCSMPDCDKPVQARDLCAMHYMRLQREGRTKKEPRSYDYTEKLCKGCNTVKSLEDFYTARQRPDGKRSVCKGCDNARTSSPEVAAHRAERQPVYGRRWYQRHKNDPEYKAGQPRRHAVWLKAEMKRREDPDYVARQSAYQAEYYRTHEKKTDYTSDAYKTWIKRHASRPEIRKRMREERQLSTQKRRALKRALPATLTKDQWQAACTWFGNACAYCGITGVTLCQEHLVPISANGHYTMQNIVPACKSCNSSKSNNPLFTWATAPIIERVLLYLESLEVG